MNGTGRASAQLRVLPPAERGRMALAELDLESLLDDVVADKVQDALAKGIDFRLHVETGLPMTLADQNGLTLSLRALLDRAVTQTETGGRITVSLYQDSGWLWLAITDSRVGPAGAEYRERQSRFEGWHTVGGPGQLVSQAQATITAAGGQLQLFSRPGQGSCVIMRLPASARRESRRVTPAPELLGKGDEPRARRDPIPVWVLEPRPPGLHPVRGQAYLDRLWRPFWRQRR